MNLLLHTCCAPCSIMCIESLEAEGITPSLFWFNPNIHPFTEYKSRRETLISYAETLGLPLILQDNYGLRDFVRAVAADIDARCGHCYAVRMEETARYAAANGYDSFSTTLFISPYQDHDALRTAAEAAASRYGVAFLHRDFRPFFREGQQKARELGLYLQKYCGCVFSEEDRYQKQIKSLKA